MSDPIRTHTTAKTRESKARFVRVDQGAIQNGDLSFRARGILAFVLSMPPTWRHSAETLAARGTEGPDAIRAALRELQRAGHAVLRKSRGPHGHVVHGWEFFESPKAKNPETVDPLTVSGKMALRPSGHQPGCGGPPCGGPGRGGPPPGEWPRFETTGIETTGIETTDPETTLKTPAGAGAGVCEDEHLLRAFVELDGGDFRELTRTDRKRTEAALSEIVAVSPNVTPAELQRRWLVLRTLKPAGCKLDRTHLAADWARCTGRDAHAQRFYDPDGNEEF